MKVLVMNCSLVRNGATAERVKDNAIKFLENKLKLTVNKDKTYVGLAKESSYLGVTFVSYGYLRNGKLGHCVPKEKAIEKLKGKIVIVNLSGRGDKDMVQAKSLLDFK